MLPFNAAVAQIRTTSLAAGRVPVGQALAPARTEFVTVLVSCCGQVEYTRLCAASLLRHSRPPCALRFLQTDALDGTADYLKGLRGVATEGIEVSGGAGQSGLSDTFSVRGDFLVLLNNDTIVTEGWLDRTLSLAYSDPSLAMLAPVSNYAPPPQLAEMVPQTFGPCAGGELEEDDPLTALVGEVDLFARELQHHHAGEWREAEALGGGCAVVRMPVLRALGLSPRGTSLRTFDVEWLSRQVRQAGYRLAVCCDVFVYYFGSRACCRRLMST